MSASRGCSGAALCRGRLIARIRGERTLQTDTRPENDKCRIAPKCLRHLGWAREELNLRPYAYQPDKSDVEARHPSRKTLADGAICREFDSRMPSLAGSNGQQNGQHVATR